MVRHFLSLGLLVAVAGCERGGAPEPKSRPPKDLVALVNGRPITATEVELRQRLSAKPGAGSERTGTETPEQALEALVLQELQAQRAVELGLDADETFVQNQQRVEAQLREVRRRELARLYRSKEVLDKTVVSEAEAKAYFTANVSRVQAELRVHQIIVTGRPAADAALAALAAGKAFEEVAAAQLPVVPPGQKPWELPVLSWEQVPTQWWDPIEKLKAGEVSPVIAAPNDRFWILKLIGRTQNPAVTLEAALPKVQGMVKSLKFEERREQLEKELRARARIERLTPGGAAPIAGP